MKKLDELFELADKLPLLVIDIVISKIISNINFDSETKKYSKQFWKLISKCIVVKLKLDLPHDEKRNLDALIFSKENDPSKNIFSGICIMRILKEKDDFFDFEEGLNVKVLKFLDDTFAKGLYREIGIDTKDQNYEKKKKIIDFISKAEEDLRKGSEMVDSIDKIEIFQANYRKKIFYKRYKILLTHFLPKELYNDKLISEVFYTIKQYLQEKDIKKLLAYENAIDILNNIIEKSLSKSAGEYFNLYNKNYIGKPFNDLKNLLKSDFLNSSFSKPAELELSLRPKKYPLAVLYNFFRIELRIDNRAAGYAHNISIHLSCPDGKIQFEKDQLEYASITSSYMNIDFYAKVLYKTENVIFFAKISWENFNNTKKENEYQFQLSSQRLDIDWDEISESEPFSLEYIETEENLIGRTDILKTLYNLTKGNSIGSAFIYGQKRVGKTSIAKVLQSKIINSKKEDLLTVYIETGEYQTTTEDVAKTINNLGLKICKNIKFSNKKFQNILIPEFNGSFSEINGFLDEINYIFPELKILIILDEFDEINPRIYRRNEIGDSFFLTLRAVSNKKNFGFILVGGEKMEIIISCQGEQINKFIPIRVDYFDKEEDYSDFRELVTKPAPYITFQDDAIETLHDYTAGNPFFAKIICKALFSIVLSRRDIFITKHEMLEAIDLAMRKDGTNSFMHFWEDGIQEKGDKEEVISINRRKILLSIADAILKIGKADINLVVENAYRQGIDDILAKSILQEFIERKILITDQGLIEFKIRYFKEWLIKYGINKVITTFSDEDQIRTRKIREENAKINSSELVEIIKRFEIYQGREITTDKIKAWLEQFGNNTNQRLIFQILKELKFYNDYLIVTKLKELYKRIQRKCLQGYEIDEGVTGEKLQKYFKNNIVLSYLDAFGKSGAEYARMFAEENGIFIKNIIEKNKLTDYISQKREKSYLIFVDDFIGTGNSAIDYFMALKKEQPKLFFNDSIKIFFGVIAGFSESKKKIEETLLKEGVDIQILIGDPLDESEMCFSESSRYYTSVTDRGLAKDICYEIGVKLEKQNPLGYGNLQAGIIFSKTCPNNTLPILWKKSNDWIPLFERK